MTRPCALDTCDLGGWVEPEDDHVHYRDDTFGSDTPKLTYHVACALRLLVDHLEDPMALNPEWTGKPLRGGQ